MSRTSITQYLLSETSGSFESGRHSCILEQGCSAMQGWRALAAVDLPDTAGFFMRNRESLVPADYGPDVRPNISCFDGDLTSQGLVILGDDSRKRFILIGALSAERSLTYISVHVRQKRFSRLSIWQPDARDASLAEPIIVLEADDWRTLLTTYAELAAKQAGVAPLAVDVEPVRGYCTWYYAYANISEADFRANLAVLKAHRDSFPATYAQIDDGYQSHHGDWLETNERWPSALADVARDIGIAGFVAGIWVMPLLASTESKLFKQHPEWFIQDVSGNGPLVIPGWSPPPEDRWVCLDASHPGAREYLRHVFTTLYAWGYRYFKLDGLGLSYPDGRRYDPAATGISCLRDCLRIIREAAPDGIILSCGGPFLPVMGLADHARLGGDTGKFWKAEGVPGLAGLRDMADWETQDPAVPSLSNALEHSLQGWWRYDRWFRADPDVAMLRDENIALREGEARMSGLVAMMTGVVFTSDNLKRMSAGRRQLLQRVSAVRLHGMEPVQGQAGSALRIYAGWQGGRRAFAVFNWASLPVAFDLAAHGPAGTCFAEYLHPITQTGSAITIPARDAILLIQA